MSAQRARLLVLFVPLGWLLWAALGFAQPAEPLRLVSDVWPPFTDVAGKPREAIDLVEAALQRAGVANKSSIMTWSRAYAELLQGKHDGSAAIWKSPEREKFLLFSKPYLENRLVLVARKGTDVSATSLAALGGKRLALTKDYAYGDAVTKAPKVQIVYRDSDDECLRAVLAKNADYLLLDELMVEHLFDHHAGKAKELIVAGSAAIVKRALHFAVRRDYPGASGIIGEFDRNIQRMMADGTYNVVLHVPWLRVDVDLDGTPEYVGSRKTAARGSQDPSTARAGYSIFNPDPHVKNPGQAAGYVIDGKSYNNWGDAATTLQRSEQSSGIYKYSTGFVLVEF